MCIACPVGAKKCQFKRQLLEIAEHIEAGGKGITHQQLKKDKKQNKKLGSVKEKTKKEE